VAVQSATKATLSYCGDESKVFDKVIKTGHVKRTAPDKTSYVLYNTQLRKNSQGVWQTVQAFSQRGAAACQP
jgi:hypothetical protein